jgi:hypothetical protein
MHLEAAKGHLGWEVQGLSYSKNDQEAQKDSSPHGRTAANRGSGKSPQKHRTKVGA